MLAENQVLSACYVDTVSPSVAEMAGMLGYDIVWCDLEHGSATWPDVLHFCRAADAGGALPLMRIPDAQRVHVLHALDAGARIVVVPMVDSPETAREIVRNGKYPPLGNRGFSGSVRGLGYGIGDKVEAMQRANAETHLFVQIETMEAVRRCAEIVGVDGISGGLVGPGDLSVSWGQPLAFDATEFMELFCGAVRTIREAGKIAATVAVHPKLTAAGLKAGLQIVVCAGDTGALTRFLPEALSELRSMVRQTREER
jgi:2-keto-3-deoxy-L-rhamnonate aldolase RhmA